MKIPKKFSYCSVEDGSPDIIITGCNGMDMLSNITYLIHYLYGRIKREHPQMAEEFRRTLIRLLQDDRSPVWEDVEADPHATEIFFVMPREQEVSDKEG